MTPTGIGVAISHAFLDVSEDVMIPNNFELETGDNFLLETGDFLLLEA